MNECWRRKSRRHWHSSYQRGWRGTQDYELVCHLLLDRVHFEREEETSYLATIISERDDRDE